MRLWSSKLSNLIQFAMVSIVVCWQKIYRAQHANSFWLFNGSHFCQKEVQINPQTGAEEVKSETAVKERKWMEIWGALSRKTEIVIEFSLEICTHKCDSFIFNTQKRRESYGKSYDTCTCRVIKDDELAELLLIFVEYRKTNCWRQVLFCERQRNRSVPIARVQDGVDCNFNPRVC